MYICKLKTNMSSQKSSEDEIKTLLAQKRAHVEHLQTINTRLDKLGLKSTVNSKKKNNSKKTLVSKKMPQKAKTSVKSNGGSRKIKATVKTMRTYLQSQGVDVKSHATRTELEALVRKHKFVRNVEAISKD